MTAPSPSGTRFERIYDAHYDAVSRYCHRRLPPGDANEAVAEVFIVAWRKLDRMPIGDHTLPWLYGVARNEVSRFRRRARRLGALREKLAGQAREDDPGPETVVIRSAEQQRLVSALETLRPADQEVLRLRAYEHLTLEEVSIVLGCSLSAAKQRSARAIRRLRKAADIPDVGTTWLGSRAIQRGGDG